MNSKTLVYTKIITRYLYDLHIVKNTPCDYGKFQTQIFGIRYEIKRQRCHRFLLNQPKSSFVFRRLYRYIEGSSSVRTSLTISFRRRLLQGHKREIWQTLPRSSQKGYISKLFKELWLPGQQKENILKLVLSEVEKLINSA